jgi:pimeloyl-ACP methyl ester carboxylesterase
VSGALARGALVAAVLLFGVALAAFSPPASPKLASHPDAARTYEEALEKLDRLRASEPEGINPVCRLRLLTHGRRVGRAVVLIHGLTNCPQQFEALGEMLEGRGANVLIARIPHHGLADVTTRDLGRLTAEELVVFGDRLIDIATGLGDSVTVSGLSLGGSLAAWLGQERSDVDRAVVIAPVFGFSGWPPALSPALEHFLLWIPDQFPWWDSKLKDKVGGPPYAYPRFSTRALGQTLRLGFAAEDRARLRAPRAASLEMVTVGGDPAISNEAAAHLVRLWERRAPGRVAAYEFPVRLHLGHDLIDPLQPYQKTAEVYPVLAALMWGK